MADVETAAIAVTTVNFALNDLSKYQLTQVNALFGNEIEKMQKRCKVKHDCTLCENSALCDWLHLAQYQVLKKLNTSTTSGGVELN